MTIGKPGCTANSVYLCGSSNPNNYETGNYVVKTYYGDSSCKNQISNSALFNGQCYSSLGSAVKAIGLLGYLYTASGYSFPTCDGPSSQTITLSDKCTLDPSTQTFMYYSVVSVQSSSSNNDELSRSAIVGIAIAVLFSSVLIIAAGIVYCNKQCRQGHEMVATKESPSTEMMTTNFSVNL